MRVFKANRVSRQKDPARISRNSENATLASISAAAVEFGALMFFSSEDALRGAQFYDGMSSFCLFSGVEPQQIVVSKNEE
jgi:hypothetical protein